MPYETLSTGLELVIPTSGTTNWATVLRNSTWLKINDHTHTGGGDGNPIPGTGLQDNSVGKQQLSKNLALWQQSLAPTGTTETIDWDLGNKVILDLTSTTGDLTLTLNNPIEGASYLIQVIQHGTTKRLITWPAGVNFPQGEEPTQYSETSWTDLVKLEYDGSKYICTWELNFL